MECDRICLMDKEKFREEIDILAKLENLVKELDQKFAAKSRNVFQRYPLTFLLLLVFAVSAVSEGVKGILNNVSYLAENPYLMLLAGLVVLGFTGVLYKKLDK